MIPWYLKHRVHGNKPWGVQREALNRSEGHARYGYFLEQGLGKTALTLNDYVHHDEVDLMLTVAPNSFKLDWALANDEWGVGHISSGYWPRDPIPFEAERMSYVVNYEAVSRSSAVRQFQKLMEQRRVLLNIDESTSIANPDSGIAKAVNKLAQRATMVRENNGTPLTNSVMDLFMQLKVLDQLDGWNPVAFRNRYATKGGYMGREIMRFNADGEPAIRHADELYSLLDRVSFRALKQDWRKDLPAQMPDTPLHLEMTPRQLMHYREMLEEFATLVDDVDVTANLIITQMMRLQQISSCLASAGDKWTWIEEPKNNPKLRALKDLIDSGSSKVLIVYIFKPSGEMLLEQLTQLGLNPAWLRGQMKPEDIIEQKRRFNEDSDCRVLVGQQSATFRGHTLIGGIKRDACDRMCFYERSFSYYEYAQIRDRIHRGAQKSVCNYWQLITSPAEEGAIDIVHSKRDMAVAVDSVVTKIRSGAWRV